MSPPKLIKKLIKKFKRSVYFSIEDYLCPEGCLPNCKAKMKAFYQNDGAMVRITESNQVGKGGFGNVYKGKWHNKPVAFKCVQIDLSLTAHRETEEYLDRNPEMRGLCYPQVRRLEKETEEFSKPFSLTGPGILQPIAFFRQQNQYDDGEKTWYGDIWWKPRNYNVYVYPLYDCNLYEMHNDFHDKFNDQILEHILSQCLTSLNTLNQNGTTHNDIKPQNFLVKFCTKKKNLMKIEIMLTDFGLTDSRGGTPLFASPEVGFTIDTFRKIFFHRNVNPSKCFSESRTMNSDLFSLGRLFLFILLPKKMFLKFLCMPIEPKQKSDAVKLIQSYPLLQLITEMTRASKRISINSLLKRFDALKRNGEIRFNNDVVNQLNEYSSRIFQDTNDYLMKLDHIS